MRVFWSSRGLSDGGLLGALSQWATVDGGVWGDPRTLAAPGERLVLMRPKQLLNMLSVDANVLLSRSKALHAKVRALSRALHHALMCSTWSRADRRCCGERTHRSRRICVRYVAVFTSAMIVNTNE